MEFLSSSFLLLLSFLFILFVMLKKGKKSKSNERISKLPPGPWKLPLIGNLHQLMVGLPHRTLRDLAKKHGPLIHLQLGEVSTIVVSSPKMAEQIMNTHDLMFADRGELRAVKIMTYNYTDIALSPYGDYWRQLRKICVRELLSTKRVQSFRSIREEEVSNLIQNLSMMAGSKINLTHRIFSLTNDVICRSTYGQKCKDKEVFVSSMTEANKLAGGFNIGDIFPSLGFLNVISGIKHKMERLHQKIDLILDNIIKEHRENRTTIKINTNEVEDLVDVLLQLQESGELEFPITIDNVKAVLLDMFTAGTDNSANTVEWAIAEMMKKPRVMEKAQAEVRRILNKIGKVDESEVHELKYLKLVIKETLRLHPSATLLLPRECRERCLIDGYEIPVKTKVIVNAWAIGRDPEHWKDAETFNPERFDGGSIDYKGTNFEYIPFGAGRRMCPGITLGIANVELLLAQLLYHFDWKLPDGATPEDLDMSECFGAAVRRRNDLYLIPILYSP